ncbi:hypothetical protein HAX54_002240 [Datura stramonium]|uniref:Uncharacterized protein n=1 Tax=Datura stramonium TaxID=4076 RepID=A0ABS8T539_DATST|nr:hypothetical protein [Datura stramonium]
MRADLRRSLIDGETSLLGKGDTGYLLTLRGVERHSVLKSTSSFLKVGVSLSLIVAKSNTPCGRNVLSSSLKKGQPALRHNKLIRIGNDRRNLLLGLLLELFSYDFPHINMDVGHDACYENGHFNRDMYGVLRGNKMGTD